MRLAIPFGRGAGWGMWVAGWCWDGAGRMPEGAAISAGGEAKGGVQVLAQGCGGAEAGVGGDPIDG